MTVYQEWLNSLEVGDKVALKSYTFGGTSYFMQEVEKITPTRRIKTNNGYTFNKDGSKYGSSTWGRGEPTLVQPTQVVLDSIEKRDCLHLISSYQFGKLPIDKIRDIMDIIKN